MSLDYLAVLGRLGQNIKELNKKVDDLLIRMEKVEDQIADFQLLDKEKAGEND